MKLLRYSVFLLVPVIALSQSQGLQFEVATIKPAPQITPQMVAAGQIHVGVNTEGNRVDIGYLSLGDLLPVAFKVKSFQIAGPDWMSQNRFDILAKMPDGVNKDQMPEMLQALLAERFQLKYHRENREHSVYHLVVAKGGPKLKESPPDPETPPAEEGARGGGQAFGVGQNRIQVNQTGSGATINAGQRGTMRVAMSPEGQMRLEMSKVSMRDFADMLSRLTDRPVIDKTELKGNYQVALDIAMDNMLAVARASGMNVPAGIGQRGDQAADPSGGSILASVKSLGLAVESVKDPVEFIVVDRLEKMPTEN